MSITLSRKNINGENADFLTFAKRSYLGDTAVWGKLNKDEDVDFFENTCIVYILCENKSPIEN